MIDNTHRNTALAWLALLTGMWLPLTLCAQGTAFTYQGRLAEGGTPANGIYDLRFGLFDAASGGNRIAGPLTNSATIVTNGLFTVALDFGGGFDGSARWLEISVRTNGASGFTALSPRQPVTAAPYAILAGDVSAANTNVARLNVPNTATQATAVPTITSGFITGATLTSGGFGYTTAPAVTVNDTTGTGALITATVSNGAVASLTVVNAGNSYSSGATLTIAPPPSNAFQVFSSGDFFTGVNDFSDPGNIFVGSFSGNGAGLTNVWLTGGNSGTSVGLNFIGTTDNQPLEFHANGQRILRLEPDNTTNIAPNFIAGSPFNEAATGIYGATIGGGGSQGGLNEAYGSFNTIGGGWGNLTGSTNFNVFQATVGGGALNTASGISSTIGGGAQNLAYNNDAAIAGGFQNRAGFRAAVAGGNLNTADGDYSGIGGGYGNDALALANDGYIGGGQGNLAGAGWAVIAGGYLNTNAGLVSFIGAGDYNTVETNAFYSVIGGGFRNGIHSSARYSAVGGGYQNQIFGDARSYGSSDIPGGFMNFIFTNADYSAIGGGLYNQIWGDTNDFGTGVIAGGDANVINSNSWNSFIGGGQQNSVGINSDHAVVAGGWFNAANSADSMIGGGYQNAIQVGERASVIGGGSLNEIQGSIYNFSVLANTIAGGDNNLVQSNIYYATIGGGILNTNAGSYSVIPGGVENYTGGGMSFAAGHDARALYQGDFVWADSQNTNFDSTANDQVSFRCQGGVVFTSGGSGSAQTVSWSPGNASWSFSSDRNLKDRFQTVDTKSILDKVSRLPILEWSYKGYSQRHIGAMAQDFHALFPLNPDDKTLNDADLHGVELAAIQGLDHKLKRGEADSAHQEATIRLQESQIQSQAAEIADLKGRLDQLEQVVLKNKSQENP